MSVLGDLYALFVAMPFLAFIIVYAGVRYYTHNRRMAGRWALNVTNLLLIQSVAVSISVTWPAPLSGYVWVCFVFLFSAVFLTWVQWRIKGRLNGKRIVAAAWRMGFFLLALLYVALLVMNVVTRMTDG